MLLSTKSSLISKFTQNLIRNLPLNPKQLKRQLADATPSSGGNKKKCISKKPLKTYNTPRPPKDPPDEYQPTIFIHKAFDAPDFLTFAIFRQFESTDEPLGPGASKCGKYKNPEYYSYHRFTFAEIQRNTLELRKQRLKDDGAQCLYDYESSNEAEKEAEEEEEEEESIEILPKADNNDSNDGKQRKDEIVKCYEAEEDHAVEKKPSNDKIIKCYDADDAEK